MLGDLPFLLLALSIGLGSADEVRLVKKLFHENDYNPLIRPVRKVNETIVVQFSVALSQIINVDEKNQIMKTNVWLQMYWYDYQLKWDPTEYGGISSIRIDPALVWKPDIVLFNNADGKYEVSYMSNVVINHDTLTYWIPPAIYKSSCSIDVEFFPFDEQECQMKFGSWTFRGDQLTFEFYQNVATLDLNDYLKSGSWDIVESPGVLVNDTQDGSKDYKTMIVFTFKLRRKTLFYTVNLIIPCVLISFVSVCVFALPADAGEKITLCISILLALVVFLLLVSKILPPSLTIPLIAQYLLFTFIMNIFAILVTVVVINRNYRTPRTHRMPYWVRVVFLKYLPKILFMERPDHEERWLSEKDTKHSAAGDLGNVVQNRRADLLELTEIHHPNCRLKPKTQNTEYTQMDLDPPEMVMTLTPEVYKATEAVKFITQHLKKEDEYETVLDDWKYIARVIDRLMLYIFLGVTIGGTLGILMKAPHILEFVDQDTILEEYREEWRKQTGS